MTKTSKLIYWATILSACSMGETAGDFVSFGLKFGYAWASCLLVTLLVMVLVAEARAKAPSAVRYWTTIVIMSTTGTALADLITRTLKLGYAKGSLLLTGLFGVVYFCEQLSQKIFPANATLEEKAANGLPATNAFYWAAILVASTFGTTMGDFVADVLKLGFGGASLLLFSLLSVVLVFEFCDKTPNKPRYWTALVITSTIGATTGDFLTKEDGLNLGYALGSGILIAVFIFIYLISRLLKPKAG